MTTDVQPLRRGLLPRVPDRFAVFGAVLLAVVVLAALLAPWLAPYPLDEPRPLERLLPPSGAHWFGTDQVGRDVLTRILYGGRTSLTIAVAVLGISAAVGVTLGVVAGYAGGWLRDVIMRVTDVFLAFPALLLSPGAGRRAAAQREHRDPGHRGDLVAVVHPAGRLHGGLDRHPPVRGRRPLPRRARPADHPAARAAELAHPRPGCSSRWTRAG
ncbi:hypothetical protein GCM10020220_034970 [Nonomuraea rubra]